MNNQYDPSTIGVEEKTRALGSQDICIPKQAACTVKAVKSIGSISK